MRKAEELAQKWLFDDPVSEGYEEWFETSTEALRRNVIRAINEALEWAAQQAEANLYRAEWIPKLIRAGKSTEAK